MDVTLWTDAKNVVDVEKTLHLFQLWKDGGLIFFVFFFYLFLFFFFLLCYQSRLLNICLFVINMRNFHVSFSAQLSNAIRTAKNNNPGNVIFHNILALADLVESQQ